MPLCLSTVLSGLGRIRRCYGQAQRSMVGMEEIYLYLYDVDTSCHAVHEGRYCQTSIH